MSRISLSVQNATAEVTLSHGKVNAMDLELCRELNHTIVELERDESIRGLIVRGNDRVFSAGVDLKRFVAEPPEYVDEFLPELRRLFSNAYFFGKPLVSAISGHALAGGCVLASAGDARLLVSDAQIGMPELRVGLALPAEGIEMFRQAVAGPYFERVVTSGASFQNQAALTAGLADELVTLESLMSRARTLIAELQRIPLPVFSLTKRQIRQPIRQRMLATDAEFGRQVSDLWRSPSVRQSVADYVRTRL